ncbi:hypothetical protein VPNG_04723 [Cytospora leucostoma]|uniref:Myb-like DNA-binding domain-containing protein n=1 Tax=Cytospora leucostoma TaxID=1230097 RepID=A0A423XAF5_9PEZI|nr:hypothetical protein VPNG_04723 [Cytospora leucostoma]
MAPLDTEAQFKFLICCIKYTNAGKVDFGEVAKELEIVSKGAAAKRYERLMKAHGITGNGNGNGNGGSPAPSGSSNPSTPKTPASNRKTGAASRSSSNKKRKLAARGNDADDDDDIKHEIKEEIKEEVKNEVKDEVKEEVKPEVDGSYTETPSGPPLEASAAATLVNMSGDAYGENDVANDEILLVSEVRRDNGGPAATVAFAQQMLTPPPENFYGFVSPAAQLHRPSQQAIAVTSMPIRYEHDANYPTQTFPLVSPEMAGHWLHHPDPAFFWGDVTRLESSPDY